MCALVYNYLCTSVWGVGGNVWAYECVCACMEMCGRMGVCVCVRGNVWAYVCVGVCVQEVQPTRIHNGYS